MFVESVDGARAVNLDKVEDIVITRHAWRDGLWAVRAFRNDSDTRGVTLWEAESRSEAQAWLRALLAQQNGVADPAPATRIESVRRCIVDENGDIYSEIVEGRYGELVLAQEILSIISD